MTALIAWVLETATWHAGRACDHTAEVLEETAGWLRWVAVAMRCVP